MDIIKSQINQAEARIQQYKDSDLHTDKEKEILIDKEQKNLEQLYLKQADKIIVNNPQQL